MCSRSISRACRLSQPTRSRCARAMLRPISGPVSSNSFTTPDTSSAELCPTGLSGSAPNSSTVNLSLERVDRQRRRHRVPRLSQRQSNRHQRDDELFRWRPHGNHDVLISSGRVRRRTQCFRPDERDQRHDTRHDCSVDADELVRGTAVSPSQINLSWGASTDTGGSGLAGYQASTATVRIVHQHDDVHQLQRYRAGKQHTLLVHSLPHTTTRTTTSARVEHSERDDVGPGGGVGERQRRGSGSCAAAISNDRSAPRLHRIRRIGHRLHLSVAVGLGRYADRCKQLDVEHYGLESQRAECDPDVRVAVALSGDRESWQHGTNHRDGQVHPHHPVVIDKVGQAEA